MMMTTIRGCWLLATGGLSLVHDAFSCVCVCIAAQDQRTHTHKTNRTNKIGSLSHFSSATEPSLGTCFSCLVHNIRDPLTQFWVFLILSFASIALGLFTPYLTHSLSFRIDGGATLPYLLMRLLLSSWFHLFSFLALVGRIYLTFLLFSFETIN